MECKLCGKQTDVGVSMYYSTAVDVIANLTVEPLAQVAYVVLQ
jgi:hypothetical protein